MTSSHSSKMEDIRNKMEIIKNIIQQYDKVLPRHSKDETFEIFTGYEANSTLMTYQCSFKDWYRIKRLNPPDLEELREKLNEWYLVERKPPNIEDIAAFAGKTHPSKDLNEYFYLLAHFGFVWKQIPNTPKALFVQKYENIANRLKYLLKIRECRRNDQHIIYLEDCTTRKNIKYQSFIAVSNKIGLLSFVMNCGNQKFISYKFGESGLSDPEPTGSMPIRYDYKTIFTCTTSGIKQALTRRVPPDMLEHLMESEESKEGFGWMEECILKAVNEPCVFVYEGFPFPLDVEITPYTPKFVMRDFLDENDIPYDNNAHRFELYDLVKKFAKPKMDEFTRVLLANGHECVHRPYEFSPLNFFDYLWPTGPLMRSMFTLKHVQEAEEKLIASEEKVYDEDRMMEEVVDKLMTMGKFEGTAKSDLTDYSEVVEFDPEFGHASMFVD